MRPIAIFRHSPTEGPGYFATFLEAHGLAWELIPVDEGAPIPASAQAYSGLCFMGGPMSVNDPLPWIPSACALIQDAVAHQIPVLGHCLGGQIMAKALGGKVGPNPVKEIGWAEAQAASGPTAAHWLGALAGQTVTVFEWHGETFSLPQGAEAILGNAYCANQMFALGPHLAMQCHVEMTPAMIDAWNGQWAEECAHLPPQPSIQTPAQMGVEVAARLPQLHQLADQIYGVWIKGLAR